MDYKTIYVKGHALKIYSDDYVRENGKKVDEITIGYGGVGGQYVYLNTSDNCGYELPVSGLIYEEYPDGRLWYYTTCNDAGLPLNVIASAEYYENGSLRDAAFYNAEEEYGVTIQYDKNGNLSSEGISTDEYEENTFFYLNGENNVETIRDRINKIRYRIEFNNNGDILEAEYCSYKFIISEKGFIKEFSENSEENWRVQCDKNDVSVQEDYVIKNFKIDHRTKSINRIKRVWNEDGNLCCKHEYLEPGLTHGIYWNDNGKLIREYFGISEILIELIYDETEKIADQNIWVSSLKTKCYAEYMITNKSCEDVSLTGENGSRTISVIHSTLNHVTEFVSDVNERKIKAKFNTSKPVEKAIDIINAPGDTRGFVDYLVESTKKYMSPINSQSL